jgi:hypothetical protein
MHLRVHSTRLVSYAGLKTSMPRLIAISITVSTGNLVLRWKQRGTEVVRTQPNYSGQPHSLRRNSNTQG